MSETFEGIWVPIADNHHFHRLQNDHPANFQVAIDAHCKRLPIAPDHPTTNAQPANPPPNHLACQFADPQEIFKARNFCVAPHVQPNCKMRYSQQMAEIIFKHDRHKAASQNLTLRETSHVRRSCRRPVRRRCRVRQVEGGVGAGGRSLEWSMGSGIWQRYRKHDHFGPDFHPLI